MIEPAPGSQAYRLVQEINRGCDLPNHSGLLLLIASVLRPIYNPDDRRRPLRADTI